MMEAVCTSETSVDNHFTRQYNPEDSSEHHTRRRENLKSHKQMNVSPQPKISHSGNSKCVGNSCYYYYHLPVYLQTIEHDVQKNTVGRY
jgi:hypothetical protein